LRHEVLLARLDGPFRLCGSLCRGREVFRSRADRHGPRRLRLADSRLSSDARAAGFAPLCSSDCGRPSPLLVHEGRRMSTSALTMSRRRNGFLAAALDYIELTKPRIAVLVLVVVVASAVVAAWGSASAVSPWAILHACL